MEIEVIEWYYSIVLLILIVVVVNGVIDNFKCCGEFEYLVFIRVVGEIKILYNYFEGI